MNPRLHTLTSPSLTIDVDRETGVIAGLRSPRENWTLLDGTREGLNFELTIPLPDKRNNLCDGRGQKLHAFRSGDGFVELTWRDIDAGPLGPLDIELTTTIEVKGEGLLFSSALRNRSPYTVECVSLPRLGHVGLPDGIEKMDLKTPGYADMDNACVYPRFDNQKGYWGVDVPTQMPFGPGGYTWPFAFLDCADKVGLYFSAAVGEPGYMIYRNRLFPGHAQTLDWLSPETDVIAGKPCSRQLDFPHLPYCAPGGEAVLTPVYLECYRGDWIDAASIYKRLKAEWNWTTPSRPEWFARPHAWLQLQMNGAEDDLRLRYTELPAVARQCRDNGIAAIQLVGWNRGGQDRGNPSHDVDPRLGTAEELREAIRACWELGVRIVLFVKFNWADMTTDWYKEELHRYTIKDGNGVECRHPGYQYQTVAQLQDLNTRRFATLCFGSEELRGLLREEFRKVAELGPDGMLYDENSHKNGAHMCFAANHGHPSPTISYLWDNTLVEEFRACTPAGFLYAGEANYDLQNLQYHLAYFRTNNHFHQPVKAFINPGTKYMTAVCGFDDREMINQCLLFGYIPSYEPYFFKGMPEDMPDTLAYGRQMMALREETAAYTWYGEMLLERGASVKMWGESYIRRFCVYRAATGKRAVVIANHGKEPIVPEVTFDGGRIGRYKAVGGDWIASDTVEIPPRCAVVVLEE